MREARGSSVRTAVTTVVLLALSALALSTCVSPPPGASVQESPTHLPAIPASPSPTRLSLAPAPTGEGTPPTSDKAILTGSSEDSGYDLDGNGLFEFLKVAVELDVVQAGGYGFTTALVGPQGQLVAVGSLSTDLQRTAPVTTADLASGRQVVPIYFDGQVIRASGIDGPYTVSVGLADEAEMIGAADYSTQAYKHLDFQGSSFEVLSISDSGVGTDAGAGYTALRIAIGVNIVAAGEVQAAGQLFAGSAYVADAAATISLDPGAQTLNLDFPGATIAASGLDGPYTVYLSLAASLDTETQTHTTTAYKHTDFRQPAAGFTGSIMDAGIDSDGNGLYEQLEVKVEVVATAPGAYSIGAILEDENGNRIDSAEMKVELSSSPREIALRFSGATINRSGADGPYHVILSLEDAAGVEAMDLRYTTSAYSNESFQRGR